MSERDRINSRPGDRGELTDADIRKQIFDRWCDAMRGKDLLLGQRIEDTAVRLQQRTPGMSRQDALDLAHDALLGPYEIIEHAKAVLAVRRNLAADVTPMTSEQIKEADAAIKAAEVRLKEKTQLGGRDQAPDQKPTTPAATSQATKSHSQPPASETFSAADVADIGQQFGKAFPLSSPARK